MLPEALTHFKRVKSFQYLNVQLNFLATNTIATDSKKHGYYNVEMVVQDRDVKFPYCVDGLNRHRNVLEPLIFNEL